MSSTTRPSNSAFWRCDRCGTPNPSASYVMACLGCGSPRSAVAVKAEATQGLVPPSRTQRRRRLILLGLVVGYGLAVLVAGLMVRLVGDAWWPGLLLLMSPRWLFLAPALPLGIVAWRMKRLWVVGIVGIEVLFVLGPIMGFSLPLGRLVGRPPEGPTLRIMTFNRGGGPNDVARLARYLDRNKVDVVCFQEFAPDPALEAYFAAGKWHRDSSGAIASRYPIVAEIPRPPEHNLDRDRYTVTIIRAKIAGPEGRLFVVASIHLPTLRPGLNRLFRGDVAGLRLQAVWWGEEMARLVDVLTDSGGLPLLIGGDFNMPVESAALSSVLGNGVFQSAFEEAGIGWGYTRPASVPWVRIDHILTTSDWTVTRCWVGPDFGSDHRSLVAEVAFPAIQPVRP